MDELAADNGLAAYELDGDIAVSYCSKYSAFVNDCDGFIAYAPESPFGKLGGIARLADADTAHRNGGAGGEVAVIGCYDSMMEAVACGSGGYYQDGGAYGSFKAV